MFEDFTATTWVALAFGGVAIFVAILSQLSMQEFRTFWRLCIDRVLINQVQRADENRLRSLGSMHGWTAQERRPYPPARERWIDRDADERKAQ